jgi:hypothetical protein
MNVTHPDGPFSAGVSRTGLSDIRGWTMTIGITIFTILAIPIEVSLEISTVSRFATVFHGIPIDFNVFEPFLS